jgi:ABC-type Na+ efflux pump permease subunit
MLTQGSVILGVSAMLGAWLVSFRTTSHIATLVVLAFTTVSLVVSAGLTVYLFSPVKPIFVAPLMASVCAWNALVASAHGAWAEDRKEWNSLVGLYIFFMSLPLLARWLKIVE